VPEKLRRGSEDIEVLGSTRSLSPLTEMYASEEFRLGWDNEVSFHVAQNSLHLRRLRHKSQAATAKGMGTSQSAIARIESGDENITLHTLKRLAFALDGRIRFSIEPKEANLPRLPAWWDMIQSGISTEHRWVLVRAGATGEAHAQHLLAGWSNLTASSTNENKAPSPPALNSRALGLGNSVDNSEDNADAQSALAPAVGM
jgi:transcriptional regulator with XRE-family HTH domain